MIMLHSPPCLKVRSCKQVLLMVWFYQSDIHQISDIILLDSDCSIVVYPYNSIRTFPWILSIIGLIAFHLIESCSLLHSCVGFFWCSLVHYFFVTNCFCCWIYFQSASNFVFKIASLPITKCAGVGLSVVCIVAPTVFSTALNMSFQGSLFKF